MSSVMRKLVWLMSMTIAFVCLVFFLSAMLNGDWQNAVLCLLGWALGIAGAMAAVWMEI